MQVSAFGFWLQIEGRSDRSTSLGLAGNSVLILQSWDGARSSTKRSTPVQPSALVTGAGVQPNSPVKVYLLPSTYLGTLTADGSGAFSGSVPIPNGLAAGSYTLQANATGTDAQVRSVSMGVIMQRSANKPASGSATVRFAMMSAELTANSKSTLRSLVEDIGTSGVRSVVLGYVQRAGGSWNDKSLSSARARNVAAFLRTLGVQGSVAAQGRGVDPATPLPFGRRVDVSIVSAN